MESLVLRRTLSAPPDDYQVLPGAVRRATGKCLNRLPRSSARVPALLRFAARVPLRNPPTLGATLLHLPAELQRGGAESAARGVAKTVGGLKGKEETEADAAQTDGKGQKGNFYTRGAGRSATQCNAKVPDMREGIVAVRRSLLWILAA